MGGPTDRRTFAPAAVLALAALSLGACGNDDAPATADATDVTDATADATGDDAGSTGASDSAATSCDGTEADVAAAVADIGEVTDAGTAGGQGVETTFGRGDGTEFTYLAEGCRFDVAIAGDEDPHEITITFAADPDGIDLVEEWRRTRDPADLRPAEGVGDEAFVDGSFGDQQVALIARDGDRVLFVRSDPPFGAPVADDATLVALAGVALADGG